ncbi:nuclear transport factor 2 family protein [Myxococcota bacterium]|nr:nuclear transport factor 2 family protein [Myxococcota bacterium]
MQGERPVRKPCQLTPDQVLELAQLHSELESSRDLEPLLATLDDEPVFEFHPPGATLSGMDRLRRYYQHFLNDFMPTIEETYLMGEWSGPDAVTFEYQLRLRVGGQLEDHQLVSVMFVCGDRLGGERLYGDERLLKLMLGPLFAELEPITGPTRWARI